MIRILFTTIFAVVITTSDAIKYVKISEPYVKEIFERPGRRSGGRQIVEPIRLGHDGNDAIRASRNRNAIKRPDQKWPNNVIPYAYATKYPASMIKQIDDAMKAIQDNTCIKFVEVTDTSKNFVVFAAHPSGTQCNSAVGYHEKGFNNAGYQVINLSHSYVGNVIRTCFTHATIVHELMHAIGLDHEQNRSDRDDFITVFMNNVNPSMKHNFEKGTTYEFFDYGCPYNYESVMHYDKTSFGIGGKSTMQTKDAKFSDIIGKAEKAHASDYEKINRMYKCGKSSKGHTCTANIPEPDLCEDNPNLSQKDFCVSQFAQNLAACDSHPQAKEFCPKTCQFCKDRKPFCLDDAVNAAACAQIAQYKQCDKQPLAKQMCKKSCNFC